MEGTVAHWALVLQGTEQTKRAAAAEKLAQCSLPLAPAMVALVQAAGDRDDGIRMWAAEALETAGRPAASDALRLAAFLTTAPIGADGESAYWAAKVLGRLGPAAAPATSALATALKESPYLAVREQAAAALGRIGPAASAAGSVLREAAAGGPPRLVRLAISALESIRGMAA